MTKKEIVAKVTEKLASDEIELTEKDVPEIVDALSFFSKKSIKRIAYNKLVKKITVEYTSFISISEESVLKKLKNSGLTTIYPHNNYLLLMFEPKQDMQKSLKK